MCFWRKSIFEFLEDFFLIFFFAFLKIQIFDIDFFFENFSKSKKSKENVCSFILVKVSSENIS